MLPAPAAETTPTVCVILSPAVSSIEPLPPLAVTSSLIARSSAAVAPEAVSRMFPPPVLAITSFVVSDPLAMISRSPVVVETPTIVPIPPTISESASVR